MDSKPYEQEVWYLADTVQTSAKILIVGDFGVGKTSLIGAVSEITPLRTEEPLTQASADVDDLSGLGNKTTTTVAIDFGRITLNQDLALYLFGTPGQRRFWDLWRELATGAVGVLVLVDIRRLEGSFDVLDQLEQDIDLPFIVAVNHFPDTPAHDPDELFRALDLPEGTPLVSCNALERASCLTALTTLVGHALGRLPQKVSP